MLTTEMEIVDGNGPMVKAPQEEVESDEVELTLDERENALAIKENTLEAKDAFAKAGIPDSMLEFVVDADKATQQANIEKFSKAWAVALKTAVKGRVAGEAPTKATNVPYKPFSEMSYKEKISMKRTAPEAYRALAK